MKTAIAALWEQIEASYGKEARDFLKGFYDERNRAYQQHIRDASKRRLEERNAFYAKRVALDVTLNPTDDIESFFKSDFDPFSSHDGDDALVYDIEINRDSYE